MKPRTMKHLVDASRMGRRGWISCMVEVPLPPRMLIITRSSKAGRGRKRQYRKIRRGKR